MAWAKGQSGNPTGRPVSRPVTEALKLLGENGAYGKIAAKLVERALEGDIKAIQEFTSRIEGKLSDRLLVESSSLDLVSLLTRKAADNAANARPADDTDVSDEPADVGANPADT